MNVDNTVLTLNFTHQEFYALNDEVRLGLYQIPLVYKTFPLTQEDSDYIKMCVLHQHLHKEQYTIDYTLFRTIAFADLHGIVLSATESSEVECMILDVILSCPTYSKTLTLEQWNSVLRRHPTLLARCIDRALYDLLDFGTVVQIVRAVTDPNILTAFSDKAARFSTSGWSDILYSNPQAIVICPPQHLKLMTTTMPHLWNRIVEKDPSVVNYLCAYT